MTVRPLLDIAPVPQQLFDMSLNEAGALFDIETKSVTGRPLGGTGFIADVERQLGYGVMPKKRGRKARRVVK